MPFIPASGIAATQTPAGDSSLVHNKHTPHETLVANRFNGAEAFNGDISKWDVKTVANMADMCVRD